MPDWSEFGDSHKSYCRYIDWHQTQKDSTDVYENKRYVIALHDTDEMIGMVGMGIEDTLNYLVKKGDSNGILQKRSKIKGWN